MFKQWQIARLEEKLADARVEAKMLIRAEKLYGSSYYTDQLTRCEIKIQRLQRQLDRLRGQVTRRYEE